MSAIVGILQLDGRAPDRAVLDLMLASLARRGPDGSGARIQGPVALGHLLFKNTPESDGETQPVTDPRSALVVCSDGRLDNREEILPALGWGEHEPTVTEPQVFLRAYEKWGEDCARRFLGEFVFVVWDGRLRKLLLFQDHLGSRELYYTQTADRFLFASEIKALLAVPGVSRKLDEIRIGCFLARLRAFPERTFYEGIQRLVPSHVLSKSPTSEPPVLRRYWTLVWEPEARLKSSEEYAEGLRGLFEKAVRSRLRTSFPAAAMLSGGLDSSAVACLAARQLAQSGRALFSLSNVLGPEEVGSGSDEREFVQAVLAQERNIEPVWLAGDARPVLSYGPDFFETHDEPAMENFSFRTTALCGLAASLGARSLLTGFGGDIFASCKGSGLVGSLGRSGRWCQMLRAARQSAKGRGVSLALVLRQELVSPSVPIWLKLGYRRFRAAFSPSRTIVNSSFARRTGLPDLIREFDLRGESELDGRIVAVNRINGGFLSGARWAGSGACGVEVSHVPLDRRIIEFCIGVPLSEFSLNGVPRSLFRRAFSGILPDSVVRRQTKGAFAPDFAARVRRDAPGAELLLRQARSGLVGEYLDISSLSDWLRRTGSGESLANSAILETVCLGMRLACFLEHFEIKKPSGAGSRPFKNFVKGC